MWINSLVLPRWLLAVHNLPFANAGHLGPLFGHTCPDSKIAKAYACEKIKVSSILNSAIAPELQETLVNQMKTSCFCIATDGSNHQGLKKMNPVTVSSTLTSTKQSLSFLIRVSPKNPMEKSFLEPLMPLCQNMVFRGVSVSR